MQAVDAKPDAVGATKEAALAVPVEHQQLLVREVELAFGLPEQRGQLILVRAFDGHGARAHQRIDQASQRSCKVGARIRRFDDHPMRDAPVLLKSSPTCMQQIRQFHRREFSVPPSRYIARMVKSTAR